MGLNQEARKIRFFHSKEEPHKIKDTLDIKRQQAENTWTLGTSLLGLVSSTIASELFVRNAFPGKPLDSYYLGMAGYASIQTLYNFVQAKRLESQAKKIAKEHVISNTQLGFRAEKFYTGKAV